MKINTYILGLLAVAGLFSFLSDILVMKFTPSLEYLLLVPWMGVQR